MSTPPRAPLIAVKLTPVGRAGTYLAPDAPNPPRYGERVVVQTDGGPAIGTVVRAIPRIATAASAITSRGSAFGE